MNSSLVHKLRQWADSGGSIRVAQLGQAEAVVELCTCTGELMERLSPVAPSVLDELARTGVAVTSVEHRGSSPPP
jgi:hypothetical protein